MQGLTDQKDPANAIVVHFTMEKKDISAQIEKRDKNALIKSIKIT